LVRESEQKTRPAFTLIPTQYVIAALAYTQAAPARRLLSL